MGAALALTSLEEHFGQSHKCFEEIINILDSREGNSMDFSQLERELEKRGKELLRTLLQEQLENRSPGKTSEPVTGSDGVDRPDTFSHDRQIETIFGRVKLNREGYGQEGCDSLHPLDAELNIPPELYSLELRRRVAEEAAKNSYNDVVEAISKTTGAEAFEEARFRDPADVKNWVALVDGDKTQIKILRRIARERGMQASRKRPHGNYGG